jgi:thiamine pyrophosphate-dependent acetolactate synthase large subunit-like protein
VAKRHLKYVGTVHSGVGYSSPRVVPQDRDLRLAADILNSGKKVAMLVGAGALQAADEVIKAAEILGAGISKALLGKAVIPDALPHCCGPIGLLGSKPSWDMMAECDTLLSGIFIRWAQAPIAVHFFILPSYFLLLTSYFPSATPAPS